LLSYGRVASADAPLDKIASGEVAEEIVQRMRTLPGAGAEIEVQEPLPPVRANKELLAEVLLCLLDNAVKFVAPGVKPRITLRAEPCPAGVRLRVEDNGIGIDPRHHAGIFGAFNRLVPNGSPGTGMGLTIAHKAVERMHGAMGLESAPGKGSCFWVELPSAE
jgi:signal transduction histidine kinase